MVRFNSIALVASIGVSACGGNGSAEVTTEMAGVVLEFSTAYAYLRTTERIGDMYQKVDPRLKIVISGASYDPDRDVRFLSAGELLQIQLDQTRKGLLLMTLEKYNEQPTGQPIEDPRDGDDVLEARLSFGVTELQSESQFPAQPGDLGRDVIQRLTLTEKVAKAGDILNGTYEINFSKARDQAATVRTGRITVEFSAPVVEELIARCNLDDGVSSAECGGPPLD